LFISFFCFVCLFRLFVRLFVSFVWFSFTRKRMDTQGCLTAMEIDNPYPDHNIQTMRSGRMCSKIVLAKVIRDATRRLAPLTTLKSEKLAVVLSRLVVRLTNEVSYVWFLWTFGPNLLWLL
jgi:hypothetical protein